MASPVTPSQFCAAVPSANADFCTRFTKFLNIPQLLCDLFGWMLNSDGSISSEFKAEVATFSTPTGLIMYSLTLNVGDGWLLCDGTAVSRTTYASLFAQIGTRYGAGDGSTTFNLPDLRGRSCIGAGTGSQGGTLTTRDISTKYIGEESHTMTESELVAHTHTWSGPQIRTEERGDGANNVWRNSLDDVTGSTGGGTPFNVIHPCFIAYPFVKT